MEENLNSNESTSETVSTQAPVQDTVQSNSEVTPVVAPQENVQSEEQNRAFADMRRQVEHANATIAKTYSQPITIGDRTFTIKNSKDLEEAQTYQEQFTQKQQYKDKGIDPDMINKIVEENSTVKEAKGIIASQQEQVKFNSSADQLFKDFPTLNAKDVPDEVIKMFKEQGIPMNIAYKAHMYGNASKTAEQDAIKALKANQTTTPGSLSSEAVPKSKFSQLSKEEKANITKQVLRGERTSLD